MSAETITTLATAISMFIAIGGLFAVGMHRIDRRFEAVDRRFQKLETDMKTEFSDVRREAKFEAADIRREMKTLAENVASLNVSVARLEGPQGRFLLTP